MSDRRFKVGDKVVCVSNIDSIFFKSNTDILGKTGIVKGLDGFAIQVEFDEFIDGHTCSGLAKDGHGWNCSYDMLKVVKPKNQCIVIYRKENQVIALDKSTGKKAVAKCSQQDEFDFEAGAKIAFDRLVGRPSAKTKPAYNGRFVVVNTKSTYLTVGKIYEVVDGCFNDDEGCNYPLDIQITSFEDLKEYLSGDEERRIKSGLVFPHYSGAHTEIIEVVE
ncbi:MAG: hypothetical protein KBS97_02480 [Firmicutes bacterium]|nr:hypothetical protein [Candidatus Fiminaster equi]